MVCFVETEVVEQIKQTEVKETEAAANTLARKEAEDTRQLVEAADMIAAAVQGEEDGETGYALFYFVYFEAPV
jgi:hypothetical protein